MKRLLILLISLAIAVVACGQEVLKRDLELRKTAPVLNLNGSGAVLQFYNGDVSLTQSTNTLTLSGGDLALGANNLTMTGSVGTTAARITKGWFTNLEITNSPTINGVSIASIYAPLASPTFTGTVTGTFSGNVTGNLTGTASLVTGFTRNGGTLTLSGGHGITVTTTGITGVTLPTSGTLATTTNIETRLQDKEDSATVGVSLATWQANVGNPLLRELQSWGLSAVGLPVGAAQPMTTNKALADGVALWQAFYLPVADTITGIRFIQRTQGGYTAADSNCVALYTVSGTTYTRVAISANNGDLWKGTGYTLQTVAFTSPYAAAAGNYMICMTYNQSAETTAPSIYCWNGSVGVSQLLTGTNAHRISGTVSAEGGPPTTEVAGDLTASDVIYGIWLY